MQNEPDAPYSTTNLILNCVSIASILLLVNLSLQILGCSNDSPPESTEKTVNIQAKKQNVIIAAFGDSLSAGYGLPADYSFPARLEKSLLEKGISASVINAGISGDTSAGGLSRTEWTLADKPDIVILELGANDGLRGLDPGKMKENLDAIIKKLQNNNVAVLLAGMKAPRNLGLGYARKFDSVFPDLAEKYDIPLYPFFLEGVAGRMDLNLDDGLHPNKQGVDEIVRRILPHLTPLICEVVDNCP